MSDDGFQGPNAKSIIRKLLLPPLRRFHSRLPIERLPNERPIPIGTLCVLNTFGPWKIFLWSQASLNTILLELGDANLTRSSACVPLEAVYLALALSFWCREQAARYAVGG